MAGTMALYFKLSSSDTFPQKHAREVSFGPCDCVRALRSYNSGLWAFHGAPRCLKADGHQRNLMPGLSQLLLAVAAEQAHTASDVKQPSLAAVAHHSRLASLCFYLLLALAGSLF
jgi:hypothetical protein